MPAEERHTVKQKSSYFKYKYMYCIVRKKHIDNTSVSRSVVQHCQKLTSLARKMDTVLRPCNAFLVYCSIHKYIIDM